MNPVIRAPLAILLFLPLPALAQTDHPLNLGDSSISCTRILARGKLRSATCKSHVYLFHTKTSEHFRCQMSLAVTRNRKDAPAVSTDGRCDRNPSIFSTGTNYHFDAAETEPKNMNSFFGSGASSVWAADIRRRKVRGCMTISYALEPAIFRCVDMSLE